MARNTAEIKADIALTRHAIEAHLDALHSKLPGGWLAVSMLVGGGLLAGALLAQLPILRLISMLGRGAMTVRKGASVAAMAAATQRRLSQWLDRPRQERTPALVR
jgi:hypothetical protein